MQLSDVIVTFSSFSLGCKGVGLTDVVHGCYGIADGQEVGVACLSAAVCDADEVVLRTM